MTALLPAHMLPVVTKAEAVAYVAAIETEWYGAAFPVLSVADSTDNDGAIDVRTSENVWTVWREENRIYGEC